MNDRRRAIADAAVEVLAARGLRGLTHRAVDTQAGLPAGSTSNLFRTRAALVTGVIDRLAERDLEFLGAMAEPTPPGGSEAAFGALDVDGIVVLLVRIATALTTPPTDRLTRARMMLAFEDQADLGPQHRSMLVVLMGALAELGYPDPGPVARAVVDYLDGAMFHAVTLSSRALDAAEATRALHAILTAEEWRTPRRS